MAGKKKVTRAAGLTLAIALGSASTMSPVAHAQEGGPSSSATSPSSAPGAPSGSASAITSTATVTTTTTAPVVATDTTATKTAGESAPNARQNPGAVNAKKASGTGTFDATYNSSGWVYTALAYNPTNDRVYAISKEAGDKKAGHLLRIAPANGAVTDLGPIKLGDSEELAKRVKSAAFTADGTLVLFEGNRIYSKNFKGDNSKDASGVDFGEARQRSGASVLESGTPAAWVSDRDNSDKLVSIARQGGDVYFWTLDVDSGNTAAQELESSAVLDKQIDELGALSYAYKNNDGAYVFADADGRTVTLQGDQVSEVDTEKKPEANFTGIAGGAKGKNTPQTGAESPTAEATTTSGNAATEPTTIENTQANPQENNQPATGEWLHEMTITVKTADGKYVEGAEFQVVGNDGKSVGSVAEDAYLGEGVYRVQVQLPEAPQRGKILKLEVTDAPVGYETRTASFRPEDTSVTITLPRDPSVSTTNVPNRILAGVKEAQPVVSSALKPIAAIAGLNAATGRKTTTRTTSTNTTSYTATRNTGGMSTGRTTRATSTSVRSNSTSARVVANQTATSAVVYTDSDDDGYLADTGTPMRAVISLGIISLLIGAAYLALGRRREA